MNRKRLKLKINPCHSSLIFCSMLKQKIKQKQTVEEKLPRKTWLPAFVYQKEKVYSIVLLCQCIHCFQPSTNFFKSVPWQNILLKLLSLVSFQNISSVKAYKIKFCLLIEMEQVPSLQKKKQTKKGAQSMLVTAKLITFIHFRPLKIIF